MAMNLLKIGVPLLALVALVSAGYTYGFAGVAGVAGVGVFWILLHFSRMMQVLKRATNRPIGYVDSAVMLNAKLRPGVPLIHVIALTRALGALQSPKEAQPEIFRWTDNSQSHVTCTFAGGKLTHYALFRPAPGLPAEGPVEGPAVSV